MCSTTSIVILQLRSNLHVHCIVFPVAKRLVRVILNIVLSRRNKIASNIRMCITFMIDTFYTSHVENDRYIFFLQKSREIYGKK